MNGMGQIATLADRLSTMSDQMLPQLAQQYKDDAITLSLILNEKNRRDRVRQTAQANPQQALQQPKVNDQVVASMQPQQLPEDVGIGTLPTPNIDNMAAGGLVAFADGGDVERYNSQGSVLSDPMYSNEGFESGQLLQTAMEKLNRKQPLSDVEKAVIAAAYPAGVVADVAAAPINLLRNVVRSPNDRSPKASYTPATDAIRQSLGVAPDTGYKGNAGRGSIPAAQDPRFIPPRNVTPIADDDADVSKSRTKASAANTGISSLPKQSAGPSLFSPEGIKQAYGQFSGDNDYRVGEMRNQLVGMNATNQQQANDRLVAEQKRQAEEGDIYKGRSDRIAAREAALGKQGEENKGMAILNAGLAIMSSRGPLGEAIGKGARVGTEQYASGIEKLRIAQERLEDAKDRTEELRLNRSDMNRRDIRQLERERDQSVLQGQQALFGFAKDMYGLDRETAGKMFSSYMQGQLTQYEQGEQTKRTDKQIAATKAANAPALALWNASMQKAGGDAFKATQLMADATADKSVMPLVKMLMTENAERRKNGDAPLTMDDLITELTRAQSALRPTSALPKGAEVAPR